MFKRYLYLNHRVFSDVLFRFRRRVTAMGWLIIGATVVTASLGLDPTLSVAYQIFTFLFCLSVVSFFGSLFNRIRISAERVLPRFGSAGEKLSYQVIVRNETNQRQRGLIMVEELPDPRPSFEEFSTTPEPGEEKRNLYDRTQGFYRWQWLVAQNKKANVVEKEIPVLAPKETSEMRLEITPLKRGWLNLTGFSLICPDAFGLFRNYKKIPALQRILILPKRYPIPSLELPGATKYQQGGVSMASSIGESEEFVSLRDYRPGDPLRRIHWKSFAKTGRPIVKEFQDEFFVRQALVLDTFDVHLHSEIFEEAVSVAASFAYTIHAQDSLLDLMFVGTQAFSFTAGRGLTHTEQMLEVLASVQPSPKQPFAALKDLVIENISHVSGCIVILLSWDEERRNFIKQMKIMGVPTFVFVVTETDVTLEPGPMADEPENFHILPIGTIGKKLAEL